MDQEAHELFDVRFGIRHLVKYLALRLLAPSVCLDDLVPVPGRARCCVVEERDFALGRQPGLQLRDLLLLLLPLPLLLLPPLGLLFLSLFLLLFAFGRLGFILLRWHLVVCGAEDLLLGCLHDCLAARCGNCGGCGLGRSGLGRSRCGLRRLRQRRLRQRRGGAWDVQRPRHALHRRLLAGLLLVGVGLHVCRIDGLEGDLRRWDEGSLRSRILQPTAIFGLHRQAWCVAQLCPDQEVVWIPIRDPFPARAEPPAARGLLEVHEVLRILLPICVSTSDELEMGTPLVHAVQVGVLEALDAQRRVLPAEADGDIDGIPPAVHEFHPFAGP
mmetsp:Transcript_144772/g.361018  ORF Transcript_144772/g.361018 Transcript_144772/m.361018 type:complete len:329 (-) Transcript_144772:1333-2319(-)